MMRLFFLIALLFVAACSEEPDPSTAEPPLILKASEFKDLPGWNNDDMTQALPALRISCERIIKRPADKSFGPLAQAGTPVHHSF